MIKRQITRSREMEEMRNFSDQSQQRIEIPLPNHNVCNICQVSYDNYHNHLATNEHIKNQNNFQKDLNMLIDCEIEELDRKNIFKKDVHRTIAEVSKLKISKSKHDLALHDPEESDFELIDLKIQKKAAITPARVEEYYGLTTVNKSELIIAITSQRAPSRSMSPFKLVSKNDQQEKAAFFKIHESPTKTNLNAPLSSIDENDEFEKSRLKVLSCNNKISSDAQRQLYKNRNAKHILPL